MISPTTPPPALEGAEEEARQLFTLGWNRWEEQKVCDLGMALLSALAGMRETVTKAVAALTEAEAILGGEYGDHYGVLCQQMIELRAALQTQEG